MDSNRYHQPRRQPQRASSIDGFVGSRRRQPVFRPQLSPQQPRTERSQPITTPAEPLTPKESAYREVSQSMLNRSLPGNLNLQAERQKKQKPKKVNKKKIVIRSALVLLVLFLATGGWLGWRVVGNLDKIFHGNIITDAQALFSNTQLSGEANGRVNILVLGDSADRADPTANGGDLTDSMMVISIDTKNDTAFMLSIPRDLWVNVPNEGWAKINSTYETDGFSGTEQLVQSDLGIPINYYALVNYQAFEDLVNAVGGITVNIQSPDSRGLYDPQPYPGAAAFKLPNGEDTLDGLQALDLARARGDAYGSYGFPQGDFDRTQHQRQMVVAIVQKAESLGVVTNPVRISQIFSALSSNVTTNLNLNDALTLAKLLKNINIANITSLAYSYGGTNPLLVSYDSGGQSALAPSAGVGNYSQLQAFYDQQVSSNPIVQENATAVVLNGSDVDGLAKQEATKLTNEGFDVTAVTDASTEYPDSMIIDQSGGKDPAAKQALQKLFSSDTTTTTSTTAPAEATEAQNYTSDDFVVVLGQNWDSTASTSTTQ